MNFKEFFQENVEIDSYNHFIDGEIRKIAPNQASLNWVDDIRKIAGFKRNRDMSDVIQDVIVSLMSGGIHDYNPNNGNFLEFWHNQITKIANIYRKKEITNSTIKRGHIDHLLQQPEDSKLVPNSYLTADMSPQEKRKNEVYQYLKDRLNAPFTSVVKYFTSASRFRANPILAEELAKHIQELNNEGLLSYPLPYRYLSTKDKISFTIKKLGGGTLNIRTIIQAADTTRTRLSAKEVIEALHQLKIDFSSDGKSIIAPKSGLEYYTRCVYPGCDQPATRVDKKLGDICEKHRDLLRYL